MQESVETASRTKGLSRLVSVSKFLGLVHVICPSSAFQKEDNRDFTYNNETEMKKQTMLAAVSLLRPPRTHNKSGVS